MLTAGTTIGRALEPHAQQVGAIKEGLPGGLNPPADPKAPTEPSSLHSLHCSPATPYQYTTAMPKTR